MADPFDEFPKPTPEVEEYLEAINTKVFRAIGGADTLRLMGTMALICAKLGDEQLLAFILGTISYGYVLKQDELGNSPHKFSIDDFLKG